MADKQDKPKDIIRAKEKINPRFVADHCYLEPIDNTPKKQPKKK